MTDKPRKKDTRDRSDKLINRLRKDFPELYAHVLLGTKTVYAASVQAGIYPSRVSINITDAISAAKTLRAKGSPTFIEELRGLLHD